MKYSESAYDNGPLCVEKTLRKDMSTDYKSVNWLMTTTDNRNAEMLVKGQTEPRLCTVCTDFGQT